MSVAAELGPGLDRGARARSRGERDPDRVSVRRRLRDAGVGLPEAPRGVPRALLPARVRRAGAPRALLVSRLSPAAGAALGRRRAHRDTRRGGGEERRRRPVRARRPRSSAGSRSPQPEQAPPFAGGAVGFFGYDLVRTVEPLGEPNPDPLGLPDLALMVCELMLSFDHLRHEVTVIGYAFAESEDAAAIAYDHAVGVIDEARAALRGPVPPPRERPRLADAEPAPGLVRAGRNRRSVALEPLARALRGQRGADRRVHARRRRVPGRALAALQRSGRGSRPSRSTAACAPSTPRRTCTSSSSATFRSPAPRPSRW